MKRRSSKELFRKRVWDLGGTLNELDSPSHTPDRDVIECVNWKVHKDGRSREKRPGYAVYDAALAEAFPDLDVPIIQIHEYTDANNIGRKVVVTEKQVLMQQEVITYVKKVTGDLVEGFQDMAVFEGKLVYIDPPANYQIDFKGTEDGDDYDLLYHKTGITGSVANAGQGMCNFDEKLWLGIWDSSSLNHVIEWDGATTCTQHQFVYGSGCYSLLVWDGMLWAVMYHAGTGTNYWKVAYYDGSSWSSIGDYDGDGYINANGANIYTVSEGVQTANLIAYGGKLYLLCSVYNAGDADHTWQVWRFDASAYDNFELIYDSHDDGENFRFAMAIEHKGQVYVMGDSAAGAGDGEAIYRSSDMVNWEIIDNELSMGHPIGSIVYEGKLFVMTMQDGGSNLFRVYYWNSYTNAFVMEKSVDAAAGRQLKGSFVIFKGDLYAGVYKALYKRMAATNTWTEVVYSEEAIETPPPKVTFDDRLILGGYGYNAMIEGGTVHSLGIEPPAVACSSAAANGSQVTDEVPHAGNGARTDFTLVLDYPYIQKSSVTVTYTIGTTGYDATDDGNGNITGTLCTGTIYYDRGLIVLEFDTAPDNSTDIEVDYKWSNLYGDYKYLVTFYRSGDYPCESNPSPESTEVTAEGQKVGLTVLPVSTDPKVNYRRIYRTTAGGAIFFWLIDMEDNSTLTYTDDIHDDSLGDEVSYDRGVPKTGTLYEVWDNRLWIAGNEEYPMMVFYTNTNTAEEMADLNFLAIRRRDGQPINQIKAFGDKLYIFKKESFFEVSKAGTSMYEVIEMPQNIGADAPWSVAKCDKLLIWKSVYGIEVFNGNTCFRPVVSEKIKNVMASISGEYLYTCMGGHNFKDHEYWLTIPTGTATEPDLTIVYDYLKMSFTTYSFNEDLRSFATVSEYVTGNLLTLIGTADGNLYILDRDYYDDAGTAISASFKTGWFNVAGEHEMWNILRRMFILYQIPADKTITLNIYTNYNETAVATISLTGSSPTPDDVERREIMRRLNLGIRGYHVMFEFINNEKVGGECKVMGWNMYFRRKVWRYTSEGD